jgi:asparagine synthase (glutamine-hydrolysing)
MCGIGAFIQLIKDQPNYEQLFSDFMKLKPRGPDMTSFQIIKNLTIVFHRLAIMDPTFHANQPYILEDGERTIIFVCNGEIYNFKELIKNHYLNISTNADCMTIPQLYLKYVDYNSSGPNNLSRFNKLFDSDVKGEFAFLLFEFDKLQNMKEIIVCRDQIGVRPLYFGYEKNKNLIFASEIKGMLHYTGTVSEFEPGTIMQYYLNDFGNIDFENKYDFKNIYDIIPQNKTFAQESELLTDIRNSVITSVKRRLDSDNCNIGFLLSGGVDSSLLSSIGAKLSKKPIRTFCCGMVGSTDIKYAKIVADHIKSIHTEILFTPEEALSKIKDVIYTTESWCTTTVRASIGQYIVCEYVGKMSDVKCLIIGEGSDEIASSYMTNWYAPSGEALHDCAIEYTKKIHMYDGKRADRNVSHFGLEARIPFLDPTFIEAYWKIPSEWRMPTFKNMEKWFLRKSFDNTNLLPESILWRKKEAFSDGISSTEKSWFQILQEYIETQVPDEEYQTQNEFNCPTKESYYYMKIFISLFGKERVNIIPHYWQPKFDSNKNIIDFNSKSYVDPSARTLNIYSDVKHS